MNITPQQIGAWYHPTVTEFIVWAPSRHQVELILQSPVAAVWPMEKDEWGYWRIRLDVSPGARYFFRLDGDVMCPDPASFSQPEGVHGPSEVIDLTAFCWQDQAWTGIPLSNQIIYELHTGSFSPTHDFDGIQKKLDYLAELGINAIELMPLAQFPGDRNWGYDGVFPFAVQHSYGGAAGLQRLVNAAHEKGIAVIVDVVYNHFGPEGNYLGQYGPYFTDKYKTPWGDAINVDDAGSDGVRNYFLQNARMWLEDYHIDTLRLDAVHAIKDFSAVTFLQELKELAMDIERRTGCRKVLIAELDLNDPRYISSPAKGGYGLDGQWVDEFHHALRTLLTGDRRSYYADFGSIGQLEKAFRDTYVYDGIYSPHRQRTFGGHADGHPYDQFVIFAQNHDQVGNRAMGDRLTDNLSVEQLKLAAAAVLLSPYVPLLFMGEEYGERNPFPFFVSFTDPALIKAVREGRAAEFKGFVDDPSIIPDPESAGTFESSVLSWNINEELAAWYRELIRFRTTRPAMQGRTRDSMLVHPAIGNVLLLERKIVNDKVWIVLHAGAGAVEIENTTGVTLRSVIGGGREIAPGGPIGLEPWAVMVLEQKI